MVGWGTRWLDGEPDSCMGNQMAGWEPDGLMGTRWLDGEPDGWMGNQMAG